jgi:hypothetical protein
MMVMMMASTPSLNASSRPLPIAALLKPGLNQAALLRKSIEGSWRIRVA